MRVFLVNEIESEAGWGSRIEDQYIFPTSDLAQEFCKKYDEEYNPDRGTHGASTPEWYMIQEYVGACDVTKEQFEKLKYTGTLVKMPENWEYV